MSRAFALIVSLWASSVLAGPVAVLTENNITIHLFNDPCKLNTEVTNLPGRATWTENGKTTEACYGGKYGVVVIYFAVDKTVGLFPARSFKVAHSS